MPNTTLAQQRSLRNRSKRSHETSDPLSVNFETKEFNATTLEIGVESKMQDENG